MISQRHNGFGCFFLFELCYNMIMKIGCHVSIAGGIFNAPKQAHDFGCEVYQIFTRSPQGGAAPKLTKEVLKQFQEENAKYEFTDWAVHTPYFINFASSNPRIKKGSAGIIREELERASLIGAKHLMTHLGSSKDVGADAAKQMVIEGLGQALKGYTGSTVFCIEISAGAGSAIGSSFADVGDMIRQIEKNDKKLKNTIGVCFDTCHAFAYGYDLRDASAWKKTLADFDSNIGLERLQLFHGNDSKFGMGEKKDRHEHINKGNIGSAGFAALLKNTKLKDRNIYLETEHDAVKKDIALLKKLR